MMRRDAVGANAKPVYDVLPDVAVAEEYKAELGAEALLERGNAFFARKMYEESLAPFALSAREGSYAARANRAAALAALGRHGDALEEAARAAREDATSVKAPYRAGSAALELGLFEEAVAAFEEALRRGAEGGSKDKLVALAEEARRRAGSGAGGGSAAGDDARKLAAAGELSKAEEAFGRAVGLSRTAPKPARAELLVGRAACRAGAGDWSGVLADTTASLELVPRAARALLLRARAFEALGRHAEGFKDVQTVLAVDPTRGDAEEVLRRLAGKKRAADAEKKAQREQELKPEPKDLWRKENGKVKRQATMDPENVQTITYSFGFCSVPVSRPCHLPAALGHPGHPHGRCGLTCEPSRASVLLLSQGDCEDVHTRTTTTTPTTTQGVDDAHQDADSRAARPSHVSSPPLCSQISRPAALPNKLRTLDETRRLPHGQ